MKFKGFDHVEFAVGDINQAAEPFLRLGFEKCSEREIRERQLKSVLLVEGQSSIILSSSTLAGDPVKRFFDKHGPSIFQVGLLCDDAIHAFQNAVNRGAIPVGLPKAYVKDFGTVEFGAVRFLSDMTFVFMSRVGDLFHEGFDAPTRPIGKDFTLEKIDHLGLAVEPADWEKALPFFETILEWDNHATSDWLGDPTLEASRTYRSKTNQAMQVTINRSTPQSPKIEEALKIHHGSLWQHVGFSCASLIKCAEALKKGNVPLLTTPPAYYEHLKDRVPGLTENVNVLQLDGIQVDHDDQGYLLQIYSAPILGALFVELLERKGGQSLGAKNYSAWQAAFQLEPQRAGVISAAPSVTVL